MIGSPWDVVLVFFRSFRSFKRVLILCRMLMLIPPTLMSFLFLFRASAQTSNAEWAFPLQDYLTVNFIDTAVLELKLNYKSASMNMWCKNGSIGNNVVLGMSFSSHCDLVRGYKLISSVGSQFQVQQSGSFLYVLFTEDGHPGISSRHLPRPARF